VRVRGNPRFFCASHFLVYSFPLSEVDSPFAEHQYCLMNTTKPNKENANIEQMPAGTLDKPSGEVGHELHRVIGL
jgi:hypothetical protein